MTYAHLTHGAEQKEIDNFDLQLGSEVPVSTGTEELLALLRGQGGRR